MAGVGSFVPIKTSISNTMENNFNGGSMSSESESADEGAVVGGLFSDSDVSHGDNSFMIFAVTFVMLQTPGRQLF